MKRLNESSLVSHLLDNFVNNTNFNELSLIKYERLYHNDTSKYSKLKHTLKKH